MLNEATRGSLERQRARRVKRAERDSGFKEGNYIFAGELVHISVSFYGGDAWWVSPNDGSDKFKLTDDIWDEMVEITLSPKEDSE